MQSKVFDFQSGPGSAYLVVHAYAAAATSRVSITDQKASFQPLIDVRQALHQLAYHKSGQLQSRRLNI